MKKIVLILLALTLLVISCAKDDEVTGPGSGNKPPTNYEPPNIDTPEAQGFKTSITTYSGAEIDELRYIYTFDANGDVSVAYNDSSRSTPQTYKFWGADPDNVNIGWYYDENGNYPMTIEFYTDIKVRNNIKYADDDKAISLMYETGTFKEPDYNQINPAQTDTADATAWKNSVSVNMKGYYESDSDAAFVFDADKNLTITYKVYSWDNDGNKTDTGKTETETLTFWGATKGSDNAVYGLYYALDSKGYYIKAFKINNNQIDIGYIENIYALMHPEKTVIRADYDKMNPTKTTTANAKAWLEKIKGKAIESRNVEKYTILNSGDIEYNENGEITTYILFGAKTETEAIYSYKINLRELARSPQAPNMIVYSYIGLILDTTKNEITIKDGFSDEYNNKLEDFDGLYYDFNEYKYKANTDWKSFPLPKSTDINWESSYSQVVIVK